jgi:hypothetical protein
MARRDIMNLLAAPLLVLAGSASAYDFGPPTTSFDGRGDMFLGTLQCPNTGMRFQTDDKGRGSVVAVTPIRCGSVTFSNLPWLMTAKDATSAMIRHAVWTTPGASCGPANLEATVSAGLVTVAGGKGACSLNVVLTTSPTLVIVP